MADETDDITDEAEARAIDETTLPAPVEPRLSQAEIDAAVGFAPPARPAPSGGVRGLVDGPATLREALPMLSVLAERFVAAATASLADHLGGRVELSLSGIGPERYGDVVDDLALPTQSFVLAAEGWHGPALLTTGPGLVFMLLDRLFGGDGRRGRDRPADRPPTAIEQSVLSRVVGLILAEAGSAFGSLGPVTFRVERVEPNPRDARVAAGPDVVLALRLLLEVGDRAGSIGLVLPLSTLAAVHGRMAEGYLGESGGRADWSDHFATEFGRAEIEARAVLHETSLPLGRILDLAVGDTLMFECKPTDLVTVRSGGHVLTRGRVGRVDGRIAVQVVERLHGARAAGDLS